MLDTASFASHSQKARNSRMNWKKTSTTPCFRLRGAVIHASSVGDPILHDVEAFINEQWYPFHIWTAAIGLDLAQRDSATESIYSCWHVQPNWCSLPTNDIRHGSSKRVLVTYYRFSTPKYSARVV